MKKYNMLAIVLVFILGAVIRSIGIENMPFQVTVVIMIVCMIVVTLSVLKYKGSKKEKKLLLSIAILSILLASVFIIAVVLDNKYPQIFTKYKNVFIALIGILFLSFAVVVLVNVICKYSKEHKSKKY
ncbi:hypothetical protein [Clostridium sp.]|jgi:CDP-diglyceride synthetase|uniref:hypothetical protein n=1 Tax=Clostridium sp. TaxID=1506 RepID=UPI003D6CD356